MLLYRKVKCRVLSWRCELSNFYLERIDNMEGPSSGRWCVSLFSTWAENHKPAEQYSSTTVQAGVHSPVRGKGGGALTGVVRNFCQNVFIAAFQRFCLQCWKYTISDVWCRWVPLGVGGIIFKIKTVDLVQPLLEQMFKNSSVTF